MMNPRVVSRAAVASLAALSLSVIVSCEADDAVAPSDVGDGVIGGSVTSAKTSAGVSDLVVVLVRDGRVVRATPTDSAGEFEFSAIDRGTYVVRITGMELSGISPRHTAFTPAEDTVAVDRLPVQLFFAAVGLIPPRIVGDVRCGGVPTPNARVRVIGGSTDVTVVTNAQGRYGATDLDPGHYAVIVTEVPCGVQPAFGAVFVQPGQALEVDFDG